MRPGRSRDTGPVFAVGRQAFVDGQGAREDVPLVDEKGAVVVGSLPDGAEVEILAWIPRGMATRYCIRSTKEHLVGWLGTSSLRSTAKAGAPDAPGKKPAPPVSIPPQMPGPPAAQPPAARTVRATVSAPAKTPKPRRTERIKRSG
ncbi:MAG: hypothetical protein ACREQY_19055 [Candidatus Binatia bacterium]